MVILFVHKQQLQNTLTTNVLNIGWVGHVPSSTMHSRDVARLWVISDSTVMWSSRGLLPNCQAHSRAIWSAISNAKQFRKGSIVMSVNVHYFTYNWSMMSITNVGLALTLNSYIIWEWFDVDATNFYCRFMLLVSSSSIEQNIVEDCNWIACLMYNVYD